MDKHSLELLIGQGLSIERIAKRFGKDPSTISYWMKKHGLESAAAGKHAAHGGIERGLLEEFTEAGMTIAAIAQEVGLSKGAVRYWLRRYGLRTKSRRGRPMDQSVKEAKEAGRVTLTRECPHHGWTDFWLEGRGYYRCKRCRVEAVARRRRRMKEILVAEAGGRCCVCGYDRCLGALEFHHLNPAEKRLEINAKGVALALNKLRAEARKCVLLCANCHAEVERGVTMLPARVPP